MKVEAYKSAAQRFPDSFLNAGEKWGNAKNLGWIAVGGLWEVLTLIPVSHLLT